jgi:DNA-binding response OmpR family regulator
MESAEILLADDDPAVLDVGTAFLRRANYKVAPAASGDIALHLLEKGAAFRLLVTDVVLPGSLDGCALARRAKEIRSSIQIIYVTGFPLVASIRSRGAPWGKTLLKPLEPDELVKTVESVLLPYRRSTMTPPSSEAEITAPDERREP